MPKAKEYQKKEVGLYEVQIKRNEEISPGVFLLSYRRDSGFVPGQVVKITDDRAHAPRIYSICSGNHEDEISILFNIKKDGYLSPRLAALVPGDRLLVSKPYGSFVSTGKAAFWIATGTGIAPFFSMFRSDPSENKSLIHGVRSLDQFYFEEEFKRSMGNRYHRCCSQEQSPEVFPGRVTEYLKTMENLPKDHLYFLCGKALMVVEVRDLLINRGIPYKNIFSEIYF